MIFLDNARTGVTWQALHGWGRQVWCLQSASQEPVLTRDPLWETPGLNLEFCVFLVSTAWWPAQQKWLGRKCLDMPWTLNSGNLILNSRLHTGMRMRPTQSLKPCTRPLLPHISFTWLSYFPQKKILNWDTLFSQLALGHLAHRHFNLHPPPSGWMPTLKGIKHIFLLGIEPLFRKERRSPSQKTKGAWLLRAWKKTVRIINISHWKVSWYTEAIPPSNWAPQATRHIPSLLAAFWSYPTMKPGGRSFNKEKTGFPSINPQSGN